MIQQFRSFARDESGISLVLAAILMAVLLGFAGLAIDIGHLVVVKNELQNAADAGAMAGANHLAPYLLTNPPSPDWDSARTAANIASKANKTDNTLIADPQVAAGYFNMITKALQSTTISPTSVDVPAVRVTVSRVEGQNTGPVATFFARVLGINFMHASAQALSMISCPSSVPPNSLLPIAVNRRVLPGIFNTTDSASPLLSQAFNIGSDYHYPDYSVDSTGLPTPTGTQTVAGEWTSFFDVKNDATTIKDLINYGNPDSVDIAQKIQTLNPDYIQPGTKASIYDVLEAKMQVNGPDFIYFLPVVDLDSLVTHSFDPVLCYIPVVLKRIDKPKKYIVAQFHKKAHMPSTNKLGGPCYGAFDSAKMVY